MFSKLKPDCKIIICPLFKQQFLFFGAACLVLLVLLFDMISWLGFTSSTGATFIAYVSINYLYSVIFTATCRTHMDGLRELSAQLAKFDTATANRRVCDALKTLVLAGIQVFFFVAVLTMQAMSAQKCLLACVPSRRLGCRTHARARYHCNLLHSAWPCQRRNE